MKRIAALAVSFAAGGFLATKAREVYDRDMFQTYQVSAALPAYPSQPPKKFGSNRPNDIMRYGFPNNSAVNMRQNYVIGYDTRLRNASWVFEHLNKEIVTTRESDREKSDFVPDEGVHRYFRATNNDYLRSGYDRGHLAAAANHRASQFWMDETFLLSNIIPQHPEMNRQAWNNLEKYVRSLAHHYDNVYVCTGPLYLPKIGIDGNYVQYKVIGENHIAVPTHLFKVVVCERNSKFELLSYVMPNEWVDPGIPLNSFLRPIETIERASGLLMFDRIPRSNFHKINHGIETML